MTGLDDGELIVGVREGKVQIDGSYHDVTAGTGQQLRLLGTRQPEVTNIPGHGGEWSWVEHVAPAADVDKRTVFEFLSWVSRETGLEIHFASDIAEHIASEDTLTGTVDLDPQSAMHSLLQTTRVRSTVENGRITVSER